MGKTSPCPKSYLKERGTALVIFIVLITLTISILVAQNLSVTGLRFDHQRRTALALAEAKTALIGWSASQKTPGILPCPEDVSLVGTPNEGSAKSTCNSLPSLGRLPWKTLGIGDSRDGNGDKLWYVISNGFRASPINLNSLPQLTVDNQQQAAVAIIFSPGLALEGQNRSVANSTNVNHYLDLINSTGNNSFVTKGPVDHFNDQLKIITRNDLFKVVNFRILGEIRGDSSQGLNRYFSSYGNYPFADINSDGDADNNQLIGAPSYNGSLLANSLFFSTQKKQILVNNGWTSLVHYSLSEDRKKVVLILGDQSLIVGPQP